MKTNIKKNKESTHSSTTNPNNKPKQTPKTEKKINDPFLNSLFKGQKFIDFQEPLQDTIKPIKCFSAGKTKSNELCELYQTDEVVLEQIDICEFDDTSENKSSSSPEIKRRESVASGNDAFQISLMESESIYKKSKYFQNLDMPLQSMRNNLLTPQKKEEETKDNLLDSYLKKMADKGSQPNSLDMRTNFTSPTRGSVVIQQPKQNDNKDSNFFNSDFSKLDDEEYNNLDFIKTLQRLKSEQRERESSRGYYNNSFVNNTTKVVEQEIKKDNTENKINQLDVINYDSESFSVCLYKDLLAGGVLNQNDQVKRGDNRSRSIVDSKSSFLDKPQLSIISEKKVKTTSIKNNVVSSKNNISHCGDKSYNNNSKNKNNSIGSISFENKINKSSLNKAPEKAKKKKIKNEIKTIAELNSELLKLSTKPSQLNTAELVNYGSKPTFVDNQKSKDALANSQQKEITSVPVVEIDLFSDEPLIENNDLVQSNLNPNQLYPVIESGDFQLKIEDLGPNTSIVSNIHSLKNTYMMSNSKADFVSVADSSVINQINSCLQQNQSTNINNAIYGTNNTNVDKSKNEFGFGTLNFSKLTNFVDMSHQYSKKSLASNPYASNRGVKK
jgi:hypothetical protein